jgi:hypothetical protein
MSVWQARAQASRGSVSGSGAHRLQPPGPPHHQRLQLRQQICVPVPQQAPQGLGVGDAVPQDPQPTQPGGMVPREVGRVLRAVEAADGGQHVDDQQAGQGLNPTAGIPVVRDGVQVGHQIGHQTADLGCKRAIERCDKGGHEGCDASLWMLKHEDAVRPSLCRRRPTDPNL